MLLYISGHSRPDIAFAVHQVARFTHSPTDKHEKAIILIGRYLKGTRDRGLVYDPSKQRNRLNAHVDADFAGLYDCEDHEDPICVKSRTGYVISFDGCPVLWKSKLQSLIALSTLEAEYIALSQCMRDLIPLRRVLNDIAEAFDLDINVPTTYSKVFEDNQGALTLAKAPAMTPRTNILLCDIIIFERKSVLVILLLSTSPLPSKSPISSQRVSAITLCPCVKS